jgi:hypothetical protein
VSNDRSASPEDVGRAGRGDLDALRRMRDHWLELASGDAVSSQLPKDEALPQLEMLAELAASASGEAADWIFLLVAYHIRAETLQRHLDASQDLTTQAAEAENVIELDRWSRCVVEFDERLGLYRAKIASLLSDVLNSTDAAGSAMLVTALSIQADRGDERAVPLLQSIMDSVTPARGAAIKAEVRKIERAAEQ